MEFQLENAVHQLRRLGMMHLPGLKAPLQLFGRMLPVFQLNVMRHGGLFIPKIVMAYVLSHKPHHLMRKNLGISGENYIEALFVFESLD
jgi:hypothetical protein